MHWLVVAEARKWHECDVRVWARCARGATAARGAGDAGNDGVTVSGCLGQVRTGSEF